MRIALIGILFFGVTFSHQINATEPRKRIVVIDTGVAKEQTKKPYMCKDGVVTTTRSRSISGRLLEYFTSNIQHGHNVIGLIGERIDVKKYCIVSIRAFNNNIEPTGYIKALKYANNLPNVVAVNLSLSGDKVSFSDDPYLLREHAEITKLVTKGVKVAVAAGNAMKTLDDDECGSFPACLKTFFNQLGHGDNFIVVGSSTTRSSNKSKIFKVVKRDGTERGKPKMSGSSQATAIYVGELFSK